MFHRYIVSMKCTASKSLIECNTHTQIHMHTRTPWTAAMPNTHWNAQTHDTHPHLLTSAYVVISFPALFHSRSFYAPMEGIHRVISLSESICSFRHLHLYVCMCARMFACECAYRLLYVHFTSFEHIKFVRSIYYTCIQCKTEPVQCAWASERKISIA